MLPGPTIIRQCVACAQPVQQETLLSGNIFGATFWTDGKMEAPMLPECHALIKCPHCQALLWIDEQDLLDEVDWGDQNAYPEARDYLIPTFADYLVLDRKPQPPVGWAELAKPNIMILLAKAPNVGQRYAFAQPCILAGVVMNCLPEVE